MLIPHARTTLRGLRFEMRGGDTLGSRLRAARKRRGLEQTEVADVLGVSIRSISVWECDRMRPYKHHLARIEAFIEDAT